MADEKRLASLVILTDSVRVLQEHVNTGNVFKITNPEQISIYHSMNEKAELSPEEYVSNAFGSDVFVKLPPDDSVSCNSESNGLNEERTKNQQLFSSIRTDSEMKLGGVSDESNSSEDFICKLESFENEQGADYTKDSFASFRSNKTMPLKTYSKLQTKNDNQFDLLKLLSGAENLTDFTHLSERENNITIDCSSDNQISDSENKLYSHIKKTEGSRRKKSKKKTIGKENAKARTNNSVEATTSGKDLVDKLESKCKISIRNRVRTRRSRKVIYRNRRYSHFNAGKGRRELYKCVTCGKAMRKIISTSKYAFRNCGTSKSRKCENCRINKIGSNERFSQN